MGNETSKMNPLYGVYSDFQKILNSLVIKYSYLAEEGETFESKKNADMYLTCRDGLDTFFTYRDYTPEEFYAVGITDASLIAQYSINDGYKLIPDQYRDPLLKNRRKSIIQNYDERNNYYRRLNGYPPVDTPSYKFHYVPAEYANKYDIDTSIPIHKIQDHYNQISSGQGDYLISALEGLGVIDKLREDYPSEEYLKFIGGTRIDIKLARKAKNFQILYSSQTTVTDILYEEFLKSYEQARDYHMNAIFIRDYRSIIPYYDQFVSVCILCMAIEITLNRQFNLSIDRNYYNKQTLKVLYEAYNVPYNMNIDEFTQRSLSQGLNVLIQKKSTDEVFYDICDLLGFDNLQIYRYYLTKERKFDMFGVPVVAKTTKFNNETGEIEEVLDFEKMYDIYFQKVDIKNPDHITAYDKSVNRESYDKITENDPFWWDDERTFNAVYETDYNFVEAKYLSIGLSYKMTEIMFDNILLLRLLMDTREMLGDLTLTLPKIDETLNITLFDATMLIFCLTAKNHNLRGEIISIPTQVNDVLEYMKNTDGGDEYLVDSFGFDLNILQDTDENHKFITELSKALPEEESAQFMSYIKKLTLTLNNTDKVELLNDLFNNIKDLATYIQYLLTTTSDHKMYVKLRDFYRVAYYSKEVKDIFTINANEPELKRTASTYFEFLHYYNPKLYYSIFDPKYADQYNAYIINHNKNPEEYTLDDYIHDVDRGLIEDFTYSSFKTTTDGEIGNIGDLAYYYTDHVISRMESYLNNAKFIYMINDTINPLEDLLIRLINFFKSFTVDILGLEIMYIMDSKIDNIIKCMDEATYIEKNIEIEERDRSYHFDVIHSALVNLGIFNSDIKLRDSIPYIEYGVCILNNREDNLIPLRDAISHVLNNLHIDDKEHSYYYDTIHKIIENIYGYTDRFMFNDKIASKYYSE